MTTIIKTIAAFSIFAALLAAACKGGGGSGPSEQATATPSPELIAAAQAAATSSNLTLADVPAGWTEAPPEEDPALGLEGDCAILDADHLPGEIAGTESNDLEGPAGQQASSTTGFFATSEEASTTFESYVSTLSDCKSQFVAAFEQLLRDEIVADGTSPDAIQALDISMEDAEPSITADSSEGYRMRISVAVGGESLEFVADIILMRQGRALGSFTYFALGEPDSSELGQIAATAASKLDAGDASLPA